MYTLQIISMFLPFLLLPYLVRTLGVENFGLISFGQVFTSFFLMIVDFGFNLSAVKIISINSEDKEKLSKIFYSIIFIKIFLILFSFFIYSLIVLNINKFQKEELFYFLMFGIVIGQGLTPQWFFQGIQRMKYITIFGLITKLSFIILVFIFIHSKKDYLYYPILLDIIMILEIPFIFYIIHNNFNLKFVIPPLNDIIFYIKYSSHFFFSRVAVKILESIGIFILGLTTSNTIVGYYSMADKLKNAILNLYYPISNVLYPYMSKEKNINLYKKIFLIINIISIFILICLFIFSKYLFQIIFGISPELSITIFNIFLIALIFNIPAVLIGYPILGAFGYTHYVNYTLVLTAIINLIMLGILYFSKIINAKTIAYVYLITVFIAFVLRAYGIKKYNILKN
jgi:PST family polysaccharide transporter